MPTRSKKERRLTKQGDNLPATHEYSIMAAFRKGPLPPPEEMEKYERLLPGATKLLFENFVNQSNHRMDLEKETIQKDIKRADRGQIMAFILGLVALSGGIYLIFLGKDAQGLASIISALATLLGAFFGGAILRRIERSQKNKK
jgi:uncharacterized membrane protein